MGLKLKDGVKNVCIPAHWCIGLDMAAVFNGGVSRTSDLTVFYSKKKSTLPNFNLPVRDTFTNEDACYVGRYKGCKRK